MREITEDAGGQNRNTCTEQEQIYTHLSQNTEAGLVFVFLLFVWFGFLIENLSSIEIKTKDNSTTASF